MMKVVSRIVTILFFPLIIIGGTNYLIDPDYTLRKDYIPALAGALSEGQLISGPVNTNSRLLKKQWIEKLAATPEVLVLGSSRTQALSKDAFPGSTFFNASVTNCTFHDMYAFLNLFEKKQKGLPKTIIICTDQWLFGESFSEKRWLTNQTDFLEMIDKTGHVSQMQFPSKWELNKEWFKELFSVRYLVRSIRFQGKVEKFEIRSSIHPDEMMFLPDGSRQLPERLLNIAEEKVVMNARNYFHSSRDEYFTALDQQQCKLFENIVNYLEDRHCNILLFIPPYHPGTFHLLQQSSQTSGIFKAENYVQAFAAKHELKVIGATNPAVSNFSPADFYDAVHLKPEVLSKVFKSQVVSLRQKLPE